MCPNLQPHAPQVLDACPDWATPRQPGVWLQVARETDGWVRVTISGAAAGVQQQTASALSPKSNPRPYPSPDPSPSPSPRANPSPDPKPGPKPEPKPPHVTGVQQTKAWLEARCHAEHDRATGMPQPYLNPRPHPGPDPSSGPDPPQHSTLAGMPEPSPLEIRLESAGAEGGGGGGGSGGSGGAMSAAAHHGQHGAELHELHEIWMREQSDGSSRLEIRLTNKDQVRCTLRLRRGRPNPNTPDPDH